jgi:hypothetical protein
MTKACATAAAALLVAGSSVQAQVVHGRVIDDATAAPLDLVSIELLDGAGERRAGTVSDSVGEFSLRAAVCRCCDGRRRNRAG